jgi:glycosyltransferase involved in cell wall biosynthesis
MLKEDLRILICIDALGVGGKERQAVELVRGLASSTRGIGFRVVCFETSDFYLCDLTSAGVAVDFVERSIRWDPAIFKKLHAIIAAYRPDVIHTNGLVSSTYALPIARLKRTPLVNGSIRNAFTKRSFRWTLERALLRFSDFRVANSHAGLRSRRFLESDPRNRVIYNGFDFGRVKRRERPALVTAPANGVAKTVGMVAEFNRYKDYPTFIAAARIITRKRQDVFFVAVGDGETLREAKAAAEGIPTVSFLGKRKDVEDIISTFDVGVLCTFVEGLSNSIMEYMALGKPVVATIGGGTPELVVDGETGFLVAERDAVALAAAIERLVDDPDLAERMGKAGHAKLLEGFSINRMIEETVMLYKQAAGGSANALHRTTLECR